MNPLVSQCSALHIAITVFVAAPSVQAAEIEEIIVSDQRRAYRGDFNNLETPQAIQTIDSLIMDQAGVRDLSEALDLSASVARQNNFGGLWNSFAALAAPATSPALRQWKCSKGRQQRCSVAENPVVR